MPSSEPLIRAASANDAEALGRLGTLLVEQHYSFDQRRFLAPTPGTAEGYGSFLASQVNATDAVVMVAEIEGRVVGYAYGTIEGHDWPSLRGPAAVLHDLLVDPAERNRAVGQALLDAMMDAFAARDAPRVVLVTAEGNVAAQRFFERASFRRTMVEMTRELKSRDSPEGDLMTPDIRKYHAQLSAADRAICERLAGEITRGLRGAEAKVWHAHPVWFLDGNPIVGYSRQKPGIRLMFWSGADFDEPGLDVVGARFKDASRFYTDAAEIKPTVLKRWLTKARKIQWDYKNIVKRRGKLVRIQNRRAAADRRSVQTLPSDSRYAR